MLQIKLLEGFKKLKDNEMAIKVPSPKGPDMSWERDFSCNPIVGMGLGPSNLL